MATFDWYSVLKGLHVRKYVHVCAYVRKSVYVCVAVCV